MLDFWHFLYLSHSLPGSKRVTRVAGASCHSLGIAAAEELGLQVKQVCWLAGFGNKHLTIGAPASQVRFVRF